MNNPVQKGTALITGASSGIGEVYSDRLANRGYDLILVARSQARLNALGARLARETGRSITALPADLNDKADLAKVEATLRDDPSITLLVNNAGTASVAPLLQADVKKMDEMITLNVTALTRLVYAAAPAFVARGAGTIFNLASVVGISPKTLDGVYGATKAFVIALSHSLQHELADKGIRIRPCCQAPPRPSFGRKPAVRNRACPRRSSCRPRRWSMRRWPVLTLVNWSRCRASMMERSGSVSRPRGATSRSGSEIPYRLLDTALA